MRPAAALVVAAILGAGAALGAGGAGSVRGDQGELVLVQAVAEQQPAGTAVTGLLRQDFRLLVDGQVRPIDFFSSADAPITIVLLLDGSSSFTTRFGSLLLIDAIDLSFLPGLKPGDRLRVGSVAGGVTFRTPFTTDRRTILAAVRAAAAPPDADRFGPSPLWDAVDAAVTALAAEPGRRAVVLITDGRSTGNRVSYRDVAIRAMAAGVIINIVGKDTTEIVLRDGALVRVTDAEVALRHLTDLTGGAFRSDSRLRGVQVDRATNAGLTRFLSRITTSLHQMYTLGFTPGDADARTHTVEVQTTKPGLTVRARQGYITGEGR